MLIATSQRFVVPAYLFAVKRLRTGLSPDCGPPNYRKKDEHIYEISELDYCPGIDVSEFVGFG
jgi:hypothetical protein